MADLKGFVMHQYNLKITFPLRSKIGRILGTVKDFELGYI